MKRCNVHNADDVRCRFSPGHPGDHEFVTSHVTLEVGYCGNCPWVDDGTDGGTRMPPRWTCVADYSYETFEELEGYGRPLELNQSPPPDWCRLRRAPVLVQLRLAGGRS